MLWLRKDTQPGHMRLHDVLLFRETHSWPNQTRTAANVCFHQAGRALMISVGLSPKIEQSSLRTYKNGDEEPQDVESNKAFSIITSFTDLNHNIIHNPPSQHQHKSPPQHPLQTPTCHSLSTLEPISQYPHRSSISSDCIPFKPFALSVTLPPVSPSLPQTLKSKNNQPTSF